jgi:hypothetical protein
MTVLRRVALGLLLAASAAVLLMVALELWNYREWAYLPLHERGLNADDRAHLLQDRVDLLTTRVGDMEKLVLILLGTSGLYAIVFVMSSYLSATSFARQADQTIGHLQDQIGLAMGDLRELQEDTEMKLREMMAVPAAAIPAPIEPARAPIEKGSWETQAAEIAARVTAWQNGAWQDRPLSEHARLELIQDESATAYLEAEAGSRPGPAMCSALAGLYLGFGRVYASSDTARSRFHLERALRLAEPESTLASEIRYELACWFAASNDFTRAMRELSAAFAHQFKALDEKLASDIEEGGRLYELASTPPFDKAVNDLLLNMSIGIG